MAWHTGVSLTGGAILRSRSKVKVSQGHETHSKCVIHVQPTTGRNLEITVRAYRVGHRGAIFSHFKCRLNGAIDLLTA